MGIMDKNYQAFTTWQYFNGMEPDTNPPQQNVFFVCTANMYRSRVAEAVFNHYATQDHLAWRAESRALTDVRKLSGMTLAARSYLESRKLITADEEVRNPKMLTVDEFESAPLIIGMCRTEHEPMFAGKFPALAKRRLEASGLRFWNIYDSRPGNTLGTALSNWFTGTRTQPADSGVEHVDFAVRALVAELKR